MNDFNQIHELYHHGTKGQKWGLRRALWYPISAFKKSQTAEKHPLKPKAVEKKSAPTESKSSSGSSTSSNSAGSTENVTATTNSVVPQASPVSDTNRQPASKKPGLRLTPTAPEKRFTRSEKKLRDKILSSNDIVEAHKNKNLFSTQELTDILTRSKAEQDMEDFIKKNKSANAKAQNFLKNTNIYTANAAAFVKNTETIYKSGKTLKEVYGLYKKMTGDKKPSTDKASEKAAEDVMKAAGVMLPVVKDD